MLGHAQCGGIRALDPNMAPLSPGDFIGKWMEILAPAAASVGPHPQHANLAEYLHRLEHVSAIRALDNLMTFPWLRARVEGESLQLHATYFDVATGLLSVLDHETKAFASVAGAEHRHLFTQPRF